MHLKHSLQSDSVCHIALEQIFHERNLGARYPSILFLMSIIMKCGKGFNIKLRNADEARQGAPYDLGIFQVLLTLFRQKSEQFYSKLDLTLMSMKKNNFSF